ncbi:hypothetical protein [Hymenobacter sp. IS2118]|uniref:hypothetical protein n=1 Tax=Hymenobacter sp. IS2118 TaxID=1505605 RepID=UPI000555592A|nr:hypothetical protein [Hymenobacter sp. IS2118]
MDFNKNNTLENFAERHRADFDSHEPRPDLWAALEQQLAGPAARPEVPLMRLAAAPLPSGDASVPAVVRGNWLQRYGVAASLVLLVVAAGASEAWKSSQNTVDVAVATAPAQADSRSYAPDEALYQGINPMAMTAADRSAGADSQLVRAVRGMEAYYTTQLASRQEELHQLNGPGMAAMTADWKRELVSLDSSYRQLKTELLHHPQPDAVLTAMNRNLQVRLDILDQQLNLGTATPEDRTAGSYVLADSRQGQ